jgi:hypothetical protein
MWCRITASRRASATIAHFIPRRLAICIAKPSTRTILSNAPACSGQPHRALPASSRPRSAIWHLVGLFRRIKPWSSVRTLLQLTWIYRSGLAHRQWRDRSAPILAQRRAGKAKKTIAIRPRLRVYTAEAVIDAVTAGGRIDSRVVVSSYKRSSNGSFGNRACDIRAGSAAYQSGSTAAKSSCH